MKKIWWKVVICKDAGETSYYMWVVILKFFILKILIQTIGWMVLRCNFQVKLLTAAELDPSVCFSIILDQVGFDNKHYFFIVCLCVCCLFVGLWTNSFAFLPCLWEISWRLQLDKTFSQTKQKSGILDLECTDKETRDRWYQQVLEIFQN